MSRLSAAVLLDTKTQWRNQLYSIGLAVGVIGAVMLAWLAPQSFMGRVIPSVLLTIMGGSTLMYAGGMIIFERDENTLAANIVSPLKPNEYLWSKLITLNLLAGLEAFLIALGALWLKLPFEEIALPDFFPLLMGIVFLGLMFTLAGIILVVRYRSVTQFLMPMGGVATIAQLPIFYFLDLIPHDGFLIIPTSAAAMLVHGAYEPISTELWIYAWIYSLATVAVLVMMARASFEKHVVSKGG